jgi:hypothetical protein
MPKLARALVVGATLAAMNLAGMTAVAQATEQAIKPSASPPLERQVGESDRHRQVAPESQTTTDPAAERALARQRYWYYQSMRTSRQQTATSDAVELFRRGERASQEQIPADAALRRVLAREHLSVPSGTPTQVPAEPSGQPGWLVASLGALAAALALIAGLAMLAAKRASRRAGAGQAA